MSRGYLVACLLAAGLLPNALVSAQTAPGQPSAPSAPAFPSSATLSEIEIRLDSGGSGGCLGRCMRHRVVVRGDGVVEYQDLGGEPRDPPQRRIIPLDEVVALVNEFVQARFFEPRHGSWVYQREGDSLLLRSRGGADGPEWNLTLRMGAQAKTVRLTLEFIPLELARLRDLVEQMGGPKAWAN